jgi:hypothetical protein
VTALLQDTKRNQLGGPNTPVPPRLSFPVETNTRIFGGGFVAENAAGNAIRPQTAGALFITGVAQAGVDNTTANNPTGAAAGAKSVEVDVGCFPVATDGSFTSLYQNAYAVDDNTFSSSSAGGTRPYAGYLIQNPLLGGSDTPLYFMIGFANPYGLPVNIGTVPPIYEARCVVTALPGAYTGSTTGVLTASGNGVIAAQNGVTPAAGDVVWLAKGATHITAASDAGPYVVTNPGAAGAPFVLTRPWWWATGQAILPGQPVLIGGEDTLFGGSRFKCFCAKGAIIDTNDPAAYPDQVTVPVTLATGTATVTGVPLRSATKSQVVARLTSGGTPDVATVGFETLARTAGEVSTGGSATAASLTVDAVLAGLTINASDASHVLVTIFN